jgi:predicted extracellular nuclease
MNIKFPVLLALLSAPVAQATTFINEIHYDNDGSDSGEAIEIVGSEGTDLAGMSLVLYNGSNGTVYNTTALSGVLSNQQGGFGTATFNISGIQNGSPDGMALVDSMGTVIQFLSYEGELTAVDGPAIGMTSTDIGVAEESSTLVGDSLQLTGEGDFAEDFTWAAASANTFGAVNTDQILGDGSDGGGGDPGGDTGGNLDSVFINEIHYDNDGTDAGEAIEVAGFADTDLTGLSLVLYNGSNGTVYNTFALSGVLPSQDAGFGTLSFAISGIQNGSPDGVALVDAEGDVKQFLSYEGELTATDGPAVGMTSTDIGVEESSSTALGFSLQLGGSGSSYADFVWEDIADNTFDDVNTNQTFVAPVPFINEIHYDNDGTDAGEGIEIAGAGSLDLEGYSLVLYNGSNGTVYDTVALSGVLPSQQDGFGTLAFAISGIQNGSPDGLALVDPDGIVLQFLSYEGELTATDGPAVGLVSTDIVVSESSSTTIGFSLQLGGQGTRYDDFAWEDAASATFDEVNNNQTFGAGGGDGGGDPPDPLTCEFGFTLIHEIQGSGTVSPLAGQSVEVQAVVTAVYPTLDAFFVQEEAAHFDADSLTSEGVLVFNPGSTFVYPALGDVVALRGDVSEFFDRTQITLSEEVLNCGQDSVAATAMTLPFDSVEGLESVEGMLLSFAQDLSVTNTFELARFGQFELSSQLRFNPTNQFLPGSQEAIDLAALNARDVIQVSDTETAQNVDIIVYPTGGLSADNTLRLNDKVSALIGVMDFSFGDYQVIPIQQPTFTATNLRTAVPELESGNLTVASFNVLNFFNGDGQGGGFPTSRGAETFADFERQAVKIVAALAAMDADIVGLIEIENDGYLEFSAIIELVERLNAEVGPGTYTFVNPGVSVIGTDEIAVGFIYKPAVVSLEGASQILDSSNSIVDDEGLPLFVDTKNRPALAQEFNLLSEGKSVVLTVNHLKSKGSDCDELGDPDTGDGQANCNLTRTRAAQAIVAWLDDVYPEKPVMVMGDLNAYAKEDPISALTSAGYTNLIAQFEGDQAYSFSFSGEVGYLDHALANAILLEKVVDATEWHINSDEPVALDYSSVFSSDFNDIDDYAPDAYRSSDHDPVLISLNFATAEKVRGDFDRDGDVDRRDIRKLLRAISSGRDIPRSFDLDRDGVIDEHDAFLLRGLCTRDGCQIADPQ